MLSYILILLAVVGIALQFSLTKLYQKRTTPPDLPIGAALRRSLQFSLLAATIAGFFFLALNGFHLQFSLFSLTMSIILSLIGITSGFIGILVLSRGPISVYTLFMMLGGMLLPFLVGIFFWEEQPSIFRIIGMIVLIGALFLPILEQKGQSAKGSRLFFLLCGVIFFLNGSTSVCSKLHQLPSSAEQAVDTNSFLVLTNLCNIVVSCIVLFFLRKHKDGQKGAAVSTARDRWLNIGIMAAYSIISGVAYMFQLIGAQNLDASLLYPMVTGGTIVFSTLAGWIFFKEKPSKWVLVSTIVTLGATCLFLF